MENKFIFIEECRFFKVYQYLDKIVCIEIKDHIEITELDIEDLLNLLQKNLGENKYPTLIIMNEFTNLTKEAKDLSASERGTKNSDCEVMIVNNFGNQLIYKMYMLLSKPRVLTNVFTSKEDGLKWLRKNNKASKNLS